MFSILNIKMPQALVDLAPLMPLNREDTDRCSL